MTNRAMAGQAIVRPACLADAPGIAAVHVAAWRSAYAGLLPAEYLATLSAVRHATRHHAAIAAGHGVLVAQADARIVGFCTVGGARARGLGDGEVETLYIEDDWRDQGLGRRLLRSGAAHLAGAGCTSAFLWVLSQNPSRWFYERLGGRAAAHATTQVAGHTFAQTAYVWDPIATLAGEPGRT